MDTVCKPDSEHQQNSINPCKYKANSPLLARIFHCFSSLALTISLTVGYPFGFDIVRFDCINFRPAPMQKYRRITSPSIMTIRLTRLFGLIGGALMALATLLAAALPTAAETAEARPAVSEKADALLSGLIETNDPGLAVLVAQNGKILFEKGYGLADREHHVPVIPQTTFRIGSIGKQFTASAILKLQEKGKLSVNDKLSKYIPDFPRGDEVTLRSEERRVG